MEIKAAGVWWKEIIIVIIFMLVFFYPRSEALGIYETADEPLYLRSSASFYYLVSEGRFDETDLIIHPGVVNLWAGAAGFFALYPDYIHQNLTEYPIGDWQFRSVVDRSGRKMNEMLAAGRAVTVMIQTILMSAALYFGMRVLGRWPAVIGFLMLCFDPYYFANSRILQPDGILAASLLLSVLAYIDYIQSRSKFSLAVSGAAAGLCWLSKLVGIVLGPMLLGIAVYSWWRNHRGNRKMAFMFIRDLAIWLVVAVFIFTAFWPVMWVNPFETLREYFTQSFLMSQDVNSPMFFNGVLVPDGEFGIEFFYYYLLVLFNLTTPVVLLGLAFLAVLSFWKREKTPEQSKLSFSTTGLLIALSLFLVILTLSSKKADRYIVSAFLFLDLLAAVGYWLFIKWLWQRWPGVRLAWYAGFAALAVGFQVFLVWQVAPYYHSYYNPMWGSADRYAERFQVGWGEGLNEAANYLNRQPNMIDKVVYSWYSAVLDSVYIFHSKEIFISPQLMDDQFEEILAADYAVIYISQWQRQPDTLLLNYLADKEPEYTVTINGFDYAKVYNMQDVAEQASP
jgi:hypothetical protein